MVAEYARALTCSSAVAEFLDDTVSSAEWASHDGAAELATRGIRGAPNLFANADGVIYLAHASEPNSDFNTIA
jgi:hypothetical protein